MLARLVDRCDAIAARWPRVFAFIGFVWVAAVALDQGKLIDLPDIPFLTGPVGIALAGAYNATWWGFVNPRIERYRAERARTAPDMKIATHG